jgi:hypothetical protein
MPFLNSALYVYFAHELCERQVLRSVEYENVYSWTETPYFKMNFHSVKFTVNLYRIVVQKFIFFLATREGCVSEINATYGKTLTNKKFLKKWIYEYAIQIKSFISYRYKK